MECQRILSISSRANSKRAMRFSHKTMIESLMDTTLWMMKISLWILLKTSQVLKNQSLSQDNLISNSKCLPELNSKRNNNSNNSKSSNNRSQHSWRVNTKSRRLKYHLHLLVTILACSRETPVVKMLTKLSNQTWQNSHHQQFRNRIQVLNSHRRTYRKLCHLKKSRTVDHQTLKVSYSKNSRLTSPLLHSLCLPKKHNHINHLLILLLKLKWIINDSSPNSNRRSNLCRSHSRQRWRPWFPRTTLTWWTNKQSPYSPGDGRHPLVKWATCSCKSNTLICPCKMKWWAVKMQCWKNEWITKN